MGGVIKIWGHILDCELAHLYTSSEQFLQFTKQDVTPLFSHCQSVSSQMSGIAENVIRVIADQKGMMLP